MDDWINFEVVPNRTKWPVIGGTSWPLDFQLCRTNWINIDILDDMGNARFLRLVFIWDIDEVNRYRPAITKNGCVRRHIKSNINRLTIRISDEILIHSHRSVTGISRINLNKRVIKINTIARSISANCDSPAFKSHDVSISWISVSRNHT